MSIGTKLMMAAGFASESAPPQHKEEWTVPGNYTWEAPEGVDLIRICAIAGGNAGDSFVDGGAGGKSGLVYVQSWDLNVIPGNIYEIIVGAGGITNGQVGTESKFDSLVAGAGAMTPFNSTGEPYVRCLGTVYSGTDDPSTGTGGGQAGLGNGGTPSSDPLISKGYYGGGGAGATDTFDHGVGGDGYVSVEWDHQPNPETLEFEYNYPGYFKFVVPAGVTEVNACLIGGGNPGYYGNAPVPGSRSGLIISQTYEVTPGEEIGVTIGSESQPTTFGTLTADPPPVDTYYGEGDERDTCYGTSNDGTREGDHYGGEAGFGDGGAADSVGYSIPGTMGGGSGAGKLHRNLGSVGAVKVSWLPPSTQFKYIGSACSEDGVPDLPTGSWDGYGQDGTKIYVTKETATEDGTIVAINIRAMDSTPAAENAYVVVYKDYELVATAPLDDNTEDDWSGYIQLTAEPGQSLDFVSGDVLRFGISNPNYEYPQIAYDEGGMELVLVNYATESFTDKPPDSIYAWDESSSRYDLGVILKYSI